MLMMTIMIEIVILSGVDGDAAWNAEKSQAVRMMRLLLSIVLLF
jgi:hypothetical protein